MIKDLINPHPEIYQKNIALLKQYRPYLLQIIQQEPCLPQGYSLELINGNPNIRINTAPVLRLHTLPEPLGGARQQVEQVRDIAGGVIYFLGFGLGYEVLELVREVSFLNEIKIIDPDPAWFSLALSWFDFSELIINPNVHLFFGVSLDDVREIARATDRIRLMSDRVKFLGLDGLIPSDKDFYKQAYSILFQEINTTIMSMSGTIAQIDKLLDNGFCHVSTAIHSKKLKDLENKFSGCPAVLVGAGPSLEKNISQLAIKKDNILVAAADSSVKKLLAHGIEPDLIGVLDPFDRNSETLLSLGEEIEKSRLLFMNTCTPLISKMFPGLEKYFVFTSEPIEAWFARLVGESEIVPRMTSVVHLLLYVLIKMGCDPIIFMGLDLCPSQEVLTAEQIKKDRLLKVKGWDGAEVYTSNGYLSMIERIEDIILTGKGSFINSTEGGVSLKGADCKLLSESLGRCNEKFASKEISCSASHSAEKKVELISKNLAETKIIFSLLNEKIKSIILLADKLCPQFEYWHSLTLEGTVSEIRLNQEIADDINKIRLQAEEVENDSGVVDLLAPLLTKTRIAVHKEKIAAFKQYPGLKVGQGINGIRVELDGINFLFRQMQVAVQKFFSWFEHLEKRIELEKRIIAGKGQPGDNLNYNDAKVLLKDYNLLEAKAVLEKLAVEKNPDANILFALAETFLLLNQPQKALLYFNNSTLKEPGLINGSDLLLKKYSKNRLLDAQKRIKQRRFKGAEKYLSEIPSGFPYYKIAKGVLKIINKSPGQADEMIQKFLKSNK
jgi:hypothetical protein